MRGSRIAIALLAGCGIAACSAAPTGRQAMPYAAPMAKKAAAAKVYVANANGVTVYAVGSTKILTRISGVVPISIALDASGNLYVGDAPGDTVNNTVKVYSPEWKLLRTIRDVHRPNSLAFDLAGNLYVANTKSNAVTVYAPGSTSVLRTITDGIGGIKQIMFDASGNLYVGNDAFTNVTVYAPGSSTVLRSVHDNLFGPVALGFDSRGNLYVGDNIGANVYTNGRNHFLRWVHRGAALSSGLALDAEDKLYIENWPNGADDSSVTVYAPRGTRLLQKISEGVNDPLGLAFDPAGNLYVANHGSNTVSVYAPGATTPLRTISQGIKAPLALLVGP